MKYRAIFLDFYGTCVAEDDDIIDRIISRIAGESGASPSDILKSWRFGECCDSCHGPTFRTQQEIERITLQEVLDKYQVELNVDELSDELLDYWKDPDVFSDTVEFLARQSVPVCIVSNIDNSFIRPALRKIDFSFESVITSEDVRSYKPRTEIYEAALSELGREPGEVVHIGDSISMDVIGAANCGIESVWINRKNRNGSHPHMIQEVPSLSAIRWG